MPPRPKRGAPKGNQNARKYPKVEALARSADGHEELTALRGGNCGPHQSSIAPTATATVTTRLNALLNVAATLVGLSPHSPSASAAAEAETAAEAVEAAAEEVATEDAAGKAAETAAVEAAREDRGLRLFHCAVPERRCDPYPRGRAQREQDEQRAVELQTFATANLCSPTSIEDHHHSLPLPAPIDRLTTLYTLRGVLSQPLCERVMVEAERVGFARCPHAVASTVLQVSVNRSPVLLGIFHAVHESLRALLRARYAIELVRWSDPSSVAEFKTACNDAFVTRYVACTEHSGITLHRDAEDFAFVVQLNPSSDFEGGGTSYPHYHYTSQLAQGDMGLHPGFVLHGGRRITSGQRCILAGFLKVEALAPSGRLLHPLRTVDMQARATESALDVSAEADASLAKLFLGL